MRDRPNGWTEIRGFLRKLQPREELPQAALPSGRLSRPAQRRTNPRRLVRLCGSGGRNALHLGVP